MSSRSAAVMTSTSAGTEHSMQPLAANRIQMQEFRREQTTQVAEFLSSQFGSSKEQWGERLERTFWRNPNLAPGICSGWTLFSDDRVVGFQGNIVHPFHVRDFLVTAATGSSWCVAPECRRFGLGFLLARTFLEQSGVDLLFMTTAGDITRKLFTRWGAIPLPTEWYDEILFWVVDTAGFLKGAAEYLLGSGFPARMASSAVSVSHLLSRKGHYLNQLGLAQNNSNEIFSNSAEWERCWEQWSPGLITGVRTPDQLSWKLAGPRKYWLSFRDDNGNLLGYTAARVDRNGTLARLRLIDMWADPAHLAVICSMVAAAKNLALKVGCSCVEVCGLSHKYREVLRSLRPYRRRMSRWPYFIYVRDKGLKSLLASAADWHPSEYDGDCPFSIIDSES